MGNTFTILSVDDSQVFLQSIKRSLARKSLNVEIADNHLDALRFLKNEAIDLLLLDVEMPERNGLSLLKEIAGDYPDLPVLMLSGHDSVEYAVQAIKLGADDFLVKPFPTKQLLKRLEPYIALWREKDPEQETISGSTFHFPGLVGDSAAINRVKSLILRIARSTAPVLLLGESGTGKELGAKAIHTHSPRNQEAFVTVDCASLNETLMESELFGHVKGSFTGAASSSLGLIRSADKGTLFLDEIGELPLPMQAKLLRCLQENEVRPVGGQQSQSVDIRVISATNRNLEQEVENGNFRPDLYFRISAIPLVMPPLRDRLEDLPLLADYVLRAKGQDEAITINKEALRLLSDYNWPGNVRELENILHRAMAFCESSTITPAELPATIALNSSGDRNTGTPANDSLEAYERLAFENALNKCDGNKRNAATLLGVSEATLYRKLKKYGFSN